MPLRPPSLLARLIEPLGGTLWVLYIVWTLLVLVVWTLALGEVEVAARVANPGLRAGVVWFLGILDSAWITLAAINGYLATVETEGLKTSRRWALAIFATVSAIAAASSMTGWPLGPIHYTSRLGMKIGPVPLGLPLLWFAFILGGRALANWLSERFFPRAGHAALAIATGLLAALLNQLLDPIAWRVRAFWIWYPGTTTAPASAPIQGLLTWTIVAIGLAWTLRGERVAGLRTGAAREGNRRCLGVLLGFAVVFIATNAAQWLGR